MKVFFTILCLLPSLVSFTFGQSFCGDGLKNGDEAGIDCGGLYCPPCFNNGAPTLQRQFTHHQFADLNGLLGSGSGAFEMALDTAGEHLVIGAPDKKVFLLKTDGSSIQQIFDYQTWRKGCPCRSPFVDISADGKKVLWTDGQGEIWVAGFDGSGKGFLADTIRNANDCCADLDYFSTMPPRFTHDGEQIIFSLDVGGADNIGLYAVNAGGGNPRKFVSVEDIGGDDPVLYGGNNFTALSISAENDILFGSSIKNGYTRTEVYIYDRNDKLDFVYPTGPPQDAQKNLKISRNGKYVLINDATVIPGTVIVLNRETDEIRTIDPPKWGPVQSNITISTNDDASLLLLNNYSLSGTQSDILVNQDGMVIYPLHQREIANDFTNAVNMMMLPNGRKLFYIIKNQVWMTELNPEAIGDDFPRMLSYSISPSLVAKNPVTSAEIKISAQEGSGLITLANVVEFDEANQPLDRLTAPGAGGQTYLFNDGMTTGDLAIDNFYTNNSIRYKGLFGNESFPDTLTLRIHLWEEDRITSYDIYPFFVVENAPVTATTDLSSGGQFRIYPTLGSEQVNLEVSVPHSVDLQFAIVDAQGQQVRPASSERIIGQHTFTLDIGALPVGTYFLALKTGGKQYVQPFVKM